MPCLIPAYRSAADLNHSSSTVSYTCLLPDYKKVVSIRIDCPQFWDIEFNHLQTNTAGWQSIVRHGIIYLKRRTGFSSKGHDTQYQYNNIVNVLNRHRHSTDTNDGDAQFLTTKRALPYHARSALFDSNKKKQADLVKAFGADPNILEFAKQFCSPFTRMGKFCGFALYECLSNAKSEMIATYIKLYHAMTSSVQNDHFMVWNVKLLNAHYENRYGEDCRVENVEPLIQREFVAALQHQFESMFGSAFEGDAAGRRLLAEYLKNGWNMQLRSERNGDRARLLQSLGAFLSYSELDCSLILRNALRSLASTVDIDAENIEFVLNGDDQDGDDHRRQNRNQNRNSQQNIPAVPLLLLPLFQIAIDSEITKIHSSFGYYGADGFEYNPSNHGDVAAARTPSMSAMGLFAQTPTRRANERATNIGRHSMSACSPRSFGLSILTNALTN